MQQIKNSLLKFLFKAYSFISFKKQKSDAFKNIAIFSTTGLGDTLWATPALKALKATYPHAKITALLSPIGKEVLLHNPAIDEVVVYSLFSFFSLFRMLKKKNFDAILLFHASQRKIFALAKLLNPPYLVGTIGRSKDLDWIFSHPIKPHSHEHEIERRLNLVYAIGVEESKDHTLQIFIQEEERKEADFYLKSMGVSKECELIGIHPGSKDLFKRWPKEYFESVLKKVATKPHQKIIITGSMQESKLVKSIAKEFPGSIPLFGQVSLRVMMAIMEKFHLYLTNDTGPMHIAYALNIPTIALFSPTNPEHCGPHHAKNVKVHYSKRCCNPCLQKKCRDPFCMRQISQDIITNDAFSILNRSEFSS